MGKKKQSESHASVDKPKKMKSPSNAGNVDGDTSQSTLHSFVMTTPRSTQKKTQHINDSDTDVSHSKKKKKNMPVATPPPQYLEPHNSTVGSSSKKRKKEAKQEASKKIKIATDEVVAKSQLNSSSEMLSLKLSSPVSPTKLKSSKGKKSALQSISANSPNKQVKSPAQFSDQSKSKKQKGVSSVGSGVSTPKQQGSSTSINPKSNTDNSDYSSGSEDDNSDEVEAMEHQMKLSSEHENNEAENTADNQSDAEESKTLYNVTGWSEEQTKELVTKLRQMQGTGDTIAFNVQMKNIKWGRMAIDLHPPRTANDCSRKLQEVMQVVRKTRTLDEMLAAHQRNELVKRAILTPFERFRNANEKAIRKRGGNYLAAAKSLYQALPEEVRQKLYVLPYDREKETKKMMPACHTALHFYILKHPGGDRKELRISYMALSEKKKLKFIKTAIGEYREAKLLYAEAMAEDPERQVKEPHNHISKDEWKLVLQHAGMPLLSVTSALHLYAKDKELPPTTLPAESLARYNAFTKSSQHAHYNAQYNAMLTKFTEKFEQWRKECRDTLLVEQGTLYYQDNVKTSASVKNARPSKRGKTVKVSTTRRIADKLQEMEMSFVGEPAMVASFKNEPRAPPITPRDVLREYMKGRGDTTDRVAKVYQKLETENKNQCIKVAQSNTEEYKGDLKKFVDKLSPHEQSLYIGQNRVRFIRVFEGLDIFENDYPCTEYPPYRSQDKQDKEHKSSPKRKEKTEIDFPDELISSIIESSSESDNKTKANEKGRKVSEEFFSDKVKSTSTPVVGDHSNNLDEEEESESEASDSSSNETQYVEPKTHTRKLVSGEEEESSEESSKKSDSHESTSSEEEQEEESQVNKSKNVASSCTTIKTEVSIKHSASSPSKAPVAADSDISSSSDSEEEEEASNFINKSVVGSPRKGAQLATAPIKSESSSEEESDEDVTEAWS